MGKSECFEWLLVRKWLPGDGAVSEWINMPVHSCLSLGVPGGCIQWIFLVTVAHRKCYSPNWLFLNRLSEGKVQNRIERPR